MLIRNLCGPMRHESWQKKYIKGISDTDKLKYYLCVKYWLCKQGVAISVPTGTSILFSCSFLLLYQQWKVPGSLNHHHQEWNPIEFSESHFIIIIFIRPPDKSAYWKTIFFIYHPKTMMWVSKEPSHSDGFLSTQKHMFKLMSKKIITILGL